MEISTVSFSAGTALAFDEAVARCRQLMASEGFGVLTEIDLRATMRKKLDVEVPPYIILGACHPPSAHRAVTAVPEVGVLLPCNVTVSVEDGGTVVRAMNPSAALGMLQNPDLEAVAAEVGAALQRVVQAIEQA